MIWKDVVGYEGIYQVSDNYLIKRVKRLLTDKNGVTITITEKIMKQHTVSEKCKYMRVSLRNIEGVRKTFLVHRLVAAAFIENQNKYPEVNHKDGNKQNNIPSNLEWCTRVQNCQHAVQTGLLVIKPGEGHRTNKKVMQIDKNGNLVSEFYSIANASQKTKIHAGDIGNCANGRIKTAGGYKWKFIDHEIEMAKHK